MKAEYAFDWHGIFEYCSKTNGYKKTAYMKPDEKLAMVAELKALIKKGNAHVSFEDALSGLPAGLRTERPGDLPYSIWQL
jgi:hypothetical protein